MKAQLTALLKENAGLKLQIAALAKPNHNKIYADTPLGLLECIGNTTWQRQNETNGWLDSSLALINELKPDFAGKIGEIFTEKVCEKSGIANISTGDINSKDGTYDQKILSKKVEIKTARLGGKKFQHETLKMDGCDYWLFLDITPKHCYMTIIPKFNLKQKNPITNTKPTMRKGTSDVFKWDFTEKHIECFIAKHMAIKIDNDTTMDTIANFIKKSVI
jgi:hypothetical protein